MTQAGDAISLCSSCEHLQTGWENLGPMGENWPCYYSECSMELDEPSPEEGCPDYKELPKCTKHPKEYIWPKEGCSSCMEEAYGYGKEV